MFCSFRQLKIPINPLYFQSKCMPLRTQTFPKTLIFSDNLQALQREGTRPSFESKPADEDVRLDPVVKQQLTPSNIVTSADLIQIVECSLQQQLLDSSTTSSLFRDQIGLSILDEISESTHQERPSVDLPVIVRHNVIVLPELVENAWNVTCVINQCDKEISRLSSNSQDSYSTVQYSENKEAEHNDSSGKVSEARLVKVQEILVETIQKYFKGRHDFRIYSKDVVFHNNFKGVITHGLSAYMREIQLAKIWGSIKYINVKVVILKATHHSEDSTIRIRWRVSGVPGILSYLVANKFLVKPSDGVKATEWIDGFSVFHVGSDGLIYKHICDKMMPDDNVQKVVGGPLGMKFAA